MPLTIRRENKYRLNSLGLPVIRSINDFSLLTHISNYTIFQLSKHSEKYYKIYTIPKKTGGSRNITQPNKKLKGLQAWILRNILDKLSVSDFCKGFEKGTSISDNAIPHIGANVILTVDLRDFFPSIRKKYIYNIFNSIGYNRNISAILTNICTYDNGLPQGSPCSPKLANLASWQLDNRIQGYVGKRGIAYTRYADDLSFSGYHPNKVSKILPTIKNIIKDEKFEINDSKTRIAGATRAKKVTGLIVNERTFGVGRKKYKVIRSKIYHLTMPENQKDEKLVNHVNGWLSYLYSVDKVRYTKVVKYIKKLTAEHPGTLIAKLITK
jgi:retron-type reverse transcriptase